MIDKEEKDICQKAIDKFGIHNQLWMMAEECGELINAIAKINRSRTTLADVITELADVSIMIEQMALFYGYEDFEREKERKLKRLEKRISQCESI